MTDGAQCAWCSAESSADAVTCEQCGAALHMHKAVEVLHIPGVTVVDPGLAAYAAQPLHLPGASPSQAVAGSAIAAAASGGPVGLAALGALAGVAAVEYLAAGSEADAGVRAERVGELDPYIVDALDRFDRNGENAGSEVEPGRD